MKNKPPHDQLCQKHKITREQINSIQRERREIPYINVKDDAMLVAQIIRVTTESNDHSVLINKLAKIIIADLTHAEYLAVSDMLIHYRREYRKIIEAINAETKEVKAKAKKETDRLWRIKQKAMAGLIEANELIIPNTQPDPNKRQQRKLSQQEEQDLVTAYKLAKGTAAYRKPTPNITTH